MIAFRPRLIPTLFTVPAVLVLFALGTWQVQRLNWKRDLIAQREAALAAAPAPLPKTADAARAMEFRRVAAAGVFMHDKEIFVGASAEANRTGYHVLTPLREAGGGIVLVNRGFIPAELKGPSRRAAGQPEGAVRVAGLLRLPPAGKPNWFLPENRPDRNYWFWIDLPAIAATLQIGDLAPFVIEADATPNPGGWPRGGITRVALPNDHLQYAIIWYALTVALIVIYVVYHRQAERE